MILFFVCRIIAWLIKERRPTQEVERPRRELLIDKFMYESEPYEEAVVNQAVYANIPTFPKPQEVLENFLVKITNRGVGMQYVNPNDFSIYVRVMPGKLHSPLPYQRTPYAVQMKNGMAVTKSGKLVPSFFPEAHIPLEEFTVRQEHLV